MTDYFALLDEARRPWLDPEELKEKYQQRSRARPADAALNEAFRVLAEPRLRLQHLLQLEGAELPAGRPVPKAAADLFWQAGEAVRAIDRWLLKRKEATSGLTRALLQPERIELEETLKRLEDDLRNAYAAELEKVREIDRTWKEKSPNDLLLLMEIYDSISYLSRLLERTAEKRFQLETA